MAERPNVGSLPIKEAIASLTDGIDAISKQVRALAVLARRTGERISQIEQRLEALERKQGRKP